MLAMNKAITLIFAFVVFSLDQLSKWAVMRFVIRPDLGKDFENDTGFIEWLGSAGTNLPFTSIEFLPFLNIVMVWNKGVSFGMFNDAGDYGPLMLIIFALFIIAIFLVLVFKTTNKVHLAAMAMIIGGALGNVIDRARFGAVVDFLDVHAFGFHWPAFNISDSCIVIGVFLLAMHSFFFETSQKDATST